ncbi:helix-turn-helix domain-containing protein [Burkholderia diffusa]|uniref:helix-turn-helix domain-containing protein n=1 Tax=Burkholderia diffusa TaxID=488732 RepID=UPI0012DB3073|nr:helix-turn-helix transcriptional regulator [Burkholderia diffusa]
MARKFDELRAKMSPAARARADKRAGEMLREIRLAEARQLVGLSQKDVAAALSVNQPAVAKLEKRGDMLVSTAREYVAALGGSLRLVAQLPQSTGEPQSTVEPQPWVEIVLAGNTSPRVPEALAASLQCSRWLASHEHSNDRHTVNIVIARPEAKFVRCGVGTVRGTASATATNSTWAASAAPSSFRSNVYMHPARPEQTCHA